MKNIFQFLFLFSFSFFLSIFSSPCETFQTKCSTNIGKALTNDFNNEIFTLNEKNNLYFTFTQPPLSSSVKILCSIFYGNIEIYAKIDSEVSRHSYDFKVIKIQDILELTSNPTSNSRVINVLIRTTTKTKFKVIPTTSETLTPLTLGIPQIDYITSTNIKNKYSFKLYNQTKISINLTPFIESDPNILITGPLIDNNSRTWSSSKLGSDSIIIIPTNKELGKLFTIEITSTNSSYYTLLLIEEEQPLSLPSLKHSVQLLSGYSIHQQSETGNEYYYVLHIPPSIISDIVVIVTPIYGDADIFVNPSQNGFYYTNQTSIASTIPAIWSSQLSFGPDSIVIDHLQTNYLRNGEDYYITVSALSNTQFIIRAFSADTINTLTEGTPLIDSISPKTYHYYRFYDSNPLQDIIFDVSPFSGDPDLLVSCYIKPTGDDSGYPSRISSHYNFSSLRSGEDSIFIDKSSSSSSSNNHQPKVCPNGIYYLAIYAFTATRVTLIATHQGGIISLHNGIPVQSTSYTNIGRLFRYTMGSEVEQITISLTPDHGDSDLFVSIDKDVNLFQWDYYSVNSGTNIDQIIIPETKMCTNCIINILVLSMEMSTFSIVVSLQDTTIQLSNLIPLQESVEANSIQYYILNSLENGTAYVVLTLFSGTPEIYLSTSIENPTKYTNNTIINTLAADGNLPISSIPILEGQTLYIGIGGAGTNSTYTIRAHIRVKNIEPLYNLLEGIPQADGIFRDNPQWNYYQINMPPGHESITLRVTPLIGNIDVYIMKCPYQGTECLGTHRKHSHSYLPNTTYYQLTTMNLEHDWITINRNDNSSVSYIAGVYSQSLYAEYHISMTLENSILMLSPGTSISDQVEEGNYDYFSVYMDETPQEFTIHLTPYSGDADLYVSTIYKKPNRTHYTWYSAAFGDDNVVIDPELDNKACKGCIYYIAVYGFRSTTYSLNIRKSSTIGRLIDGIPITDSVDYFSYVRYTFKNTYGLGRSFKITLLALTGNPIVYVTLDDTIPSFLNHDYSASSWTSTSIKININPSDQKYIPCLDTDCNIRIAVYGIVESSYILTLTSSLSSTLLQLNVPVSVEVAVNSYDYFKVILSDKTSTLKLSLTEFTGVTIMYVSCHSLYPNTTLNSHDWYYYPSNRNQLNYLQITSLDASDKLCPLTGEFYIGIKGITSATYSLMASITQNNTIPRIIPGTIIPGMIEYKTFDYYYYRPNENQGLDIRLQVIVNTGDVDIYIGSSWNKRPYYSTISNKVISYILSSSTVGDENILIRHKLLSNICENRLDDCYIIIGVYGVYNAGNVSKSSYKLHLTTEDMTITLSTGQAIRGSLERFELSYYKYSITEPNKDVIISVTPFLGDPDMYVSLYPLVHPSSQNYTWMVASWGADVLTIQYDDLSKYCIPIPLIGKICDLHIGIYAWENTTYSILAQIDDGSKHPTILTDGQTQSGYVNLGSYIYYTFYINGRTNHQLTDKLQITLSTIDGDQDMYIKFNDDSEPGKTNYDYQSTNFGGVADEIIVSSNMNHFCINCYVNIAVFGFKAGHYSIVATSKGIIELQSGIAIGGHLEQSQYRYYSIYNSNPTASLTFSLTAISGDPDLYITTYQLNSDSSVDSSSIITTSNININNNINNNNNVNFEYPTINHFTWRSMHAGRDDIIIDYSDHLFCSDCIYIIGVYSYRNSSYTLLSTYTEDAIISLIPNRPQVVHVRETTKLKYFKLISRSSSEDITVSLTNYGSTNCVMYMEKYLLSTYNGSLPNPNIPSSYSYTTLHTGVESLFARGPNKDPVIYVVGVKVNIPTSYSIMMSTSSQPVILRSGIPQIHYAQQGYMAQFIYYMVDLVDVQITISALSGDPDMFVSENNSPSCKVDDQMYWRVYCTNFTWASTSYSTDQLIISKDLPCSPIMPGTTIRNCDASKYGNGPLHIGVYGYSSSRFIIMANIRGEHITLLPGKIQKSITSTSIVCSSRNSLNGVCLETATSAQVSAAYFTFSVSNHESINSNIFNNNNNNNAIYITVRPFCNSSLTASKSSSSSDCIPGCDCNPIELYVLSCPASKCTASDKYPSYFNGQYRAHMSITSTSNNLLISSLTPSVYCNPSIIGETCIYYIALISKQTKKDIVFSIDIQNPDDVSIISCDSTPSPDGYKLSKLISNPLPSSSSSLKLISNSYSQFYELCSSSTLKTNTDKILVTIEQCVGDSKLYACSNGACDSYLPSEKSWEYLANTDESCQKILTTNDANYNYGIITGNSNSNNNNLNNNININMNMNSVKSECLPNHDIMNRPHLSLPLQSGNYHIKVNGTGKYYINIQNTINGEIVEPTFQFDNSDMNGGIHSIQSTDTTITISWNKVGILMPGELKPKKTINILYSLYIFEESELLGLIFEYKSNYKMSLVLDTKCGLDYILSLSKNGKVITIPTIEVESITEMKYTISNLNKETNYAIYLMSECDETCLKQISKTIVSTHYVSCNGAVNCHPQKYSYGSVSVTTSSSDKSNGESSNGSSGLDMEKMDSFILIIIICLVAVVSFLFGSISYYYKKQKEFDDIQTFEMVDFNSSNGSINDDSESSYAPPSDHNNNNNNNNNNSLFKFLNIKQTQKNNKGPILHSQIPPVQSKTSNNNNNGNNNNSGSIGSNRSMMSKVSLPNKSPFFSSYSPLIKDDQDDDEEVTIDL